MSVSRENDDSSKIVSFSMYPVIYNVQLFCECLDVSFFELWSYNGGNFAAVVAVYKFKTLWIALVNDCIISGLFFKKLFLAQYAVYGT